MDPWPRRWAAFTTAALASFVVLETLAMRQPLPHPTYSRTLARWFGCHPRRRHRELALAAFCAAELALAAHVARYHEPVRQVNL